MNKKVKMTCGCCGKELENRDIISIGVSTGICLDCAYAIRDVDIEDIIDKFPVRPETVITNDNGTMTVLIYKRPTLEECGG